MYRKYLYPVFRAINSQTTYFSGITMHEPSYAKGEYDDHFKSKKSMSTKKCLCFTGRFYVSDRTHMVVNRVPSDYVEEVSKL